MGAESGLFLVAMTMIGSYSLFIHLLHGLDRLSEKADERRIFGPPDSAENQIIEAYADACAEDLGLERSHAQVMTKLRVEILKKELQRVRRERNTA